MSIVEDPTVTVKCRTAIKALFLYNTSEQQMMKLNLLNMYHNTGIYTWLLDGLDPLPLPGRLLSFDDLESKRSKITSLNTNF
jgi:hypothetical protein